MKLKLNSFFLMFLLPAFNAECQGFLKVSGRQIVNEKGENVLLRGIGLGGWMPAENVKLENCHINYNVLKALFRR